MSVVRYVDGVYDMCMCLAWGGVRDVGGDRIGFGFYQFWRNMGKVVCVLVAVVWMVLGEWVGGLGQGLGGWSGVMPVCVVSLESVYCARRIPVHLRCTQ